MIAQAREAGAQGRRTILFLDKIHRFNKAQQDALLPAVEEAILTLIGATTENPYFEVNSALLSAQVYGLRRSPGRTWRSSCAVERTKPRQRYRPKPSGSSPCAPAAMPGMR